MGGYNHRSVIFAKTNVNSAADLQNIPYDEISPVNVVSIEVGCLRAGNLNKLHSVTLATVA